MINDQRKLLFSELCPAIVEAKNAGPLLVMYSAPANTTPADFPQVPGHAVFSRLPRAHPWISRRLEVATMYPPRSNRRGQDGCPSPAHLYPPTSPHYPPTYPHCPPYPPPPTYPGPGGRGAAGQLTLLIRRGGGRQGGGGVTSQEEGGGGGAAPEQRRS